MLETCNLLGCCLSVLSEECSCWLSVCAASSVCCGGTTAISPWPCQPRVPSRDTLGPVVPRFWAVPLACPSLLLSTGMMVGLWGCRGCTQDHVEGLGSAELSTFLVLHSHPVIATIL